MEAIASRAGSDVFSSAPRNSDTPPAKRSKGLSSNEVCKEKTIEALDLLVQQRHVLKKSKLPLCQLILREYPKPSEGGGSAPVRAAPNPGVFGEIVLVAEDPEIRPKEQARREFAQFYALFENEHVKTD